MSKWSEVTPGRPSSCWKASVTAARTGTRRRRRRARPEVAAKPWCTPPRTSASPLCSFFCWQRRWAHADAASETPCWPVWPGCALFRSAGPRPRAAAGEWSNPGRWKWGAVCSAEAPASWSAVSSAPWFCSESRRQRTQRWGARRRRCLARGRARWGRCAQMWRQSAWCWWLWSPSLTAGLRWWMQGGSVRAEADGELLSCLSRGDRVANSSSSLLTGYSTSRSDLNFGSTPLFQHAPRHTPLPPPFARRTLRAEAPPPLCDSSARRLPPGQARGSGSSINNPELSLGREHALGSFTFQCL